MKLSRIRWQCPAIVWLALLHLTLAALPESDVENPIKNEDSDEVLLQNTIKQLLDIHDHPASTVDQKWAARSAKAAAHLMRNVYDKYTHLVHGTADGDIVRSITPAEPEGSDQSAAVDFNIGVIKPGEQVQRAQLYFRLRRSQARARFMRRPNYTAFVRLLADSTNSSSLTVPLGRPRLWQHWLIWDARTALDEALGLEVDRLQMVVEKLNGKTAARFTKVDPRRLIARHTPVLMVHSKNIDSNSLKALEELSTQVRRRRKRDTTTYVDPKFFSYEYQRRLVTNQYTTTTTEGPKDKHWQLRQTLSQGPDMFHTKKEMRRNRKRQRKLDTSAVANSDLAMPSYSVDGLAAGNDNLMIQSSSQSHCSKHVLTVDFGQIGWQHRIIAPRHFAADYCAGDCGFPIKRESNPSNHALLQSILHRVGSHLYIPDVSCGADRMDSLTLLYFDDDNNVVLKNYPKMVVKSCGCV